MVYLRGRIWWVKYYRDGEYFCESTKSQDRAAAEAYLDVRLKNALSDPRELQKAINATALGLCSRNMASQGTIGAISELSVACHLMNLGYDVFRSLSPHASCDLVAIKGQRVLRIEVKTAGTKYGKIVKPTVTNHGKFEHLAMVVRRRGVVFDPPLEAK